VASDPAAIRPATLIDSCVLLDVITGDKRWADWSAARIADAVDEGRAVINPLMAGFAAGKAFLQYRRSGGQKRCPMPCFYIGAHAAVAGYRLLTRHVSRYRTYFPTIDLIVPSQDEDET
jgi:hypothetical protein